MSDASARDGVKAPPRAPAAEPLKLGTFSVGLPVKNLQASKAVYEKLDFAQVAGDVKQRWVVLQDGTTKIALFQGFLPRATLTFNPGVDYEGKPLKESRTSASCSASSRSAA